MDCRLLLPRSFLSIYSCLSGAACFLLACTNVLCSESRRFSSHFVAIVAKVWCQLRATVHSCDLHVCLWAASSFFSAKCTLSFPLLARCFENFILCFAHLFFRMSRQLQERRKKNARDIFTPSDPSSWLMRRVPAKIVINCGISCASSAAVTCPLVCHCT